MNELRRSERVKKRLKKRLYDQDRAKAVAASPYAIVRVRQPEHTEELLRQVEAQGGWDATFRAIEIKASVTLGAEEKRIIYDIIRLDGGALYKFASIYGDEVNRLKSRMDDEDLLRAQMVARNGAHILAALCAQADPGSLLTAEEVAKAVSGKWLDFWICKEATVSDPGVKLQHSPGYADANAPVLDVLAAAAIAVDTDGDVEMN